MSSPAGRRFGRECSGLAKGATSPEPLVQEALAPTQVNPGFCLSQDDRALGASWDRGHGASGLAPDQQQLQPQEHLGTRALSQAQGRHCPAQALVTLGAPGAHGPEGLQSANDSWRQPSLSTQAPDVTPRWTLMATRFL